MTSLSNGISVAPRGQAEEVLRHRSSGPQVVTVKPLDQSTAYTLAVQKQRDGVVSSVAAEGDAVVTDEDTGYSGDGVATTFTSNSLASLPAPGSLDLGGSSTSVKDLSKDGLLYVDGPALLPAASGTFAAMAAESMVVKVDGGDDQTITFGTEGTIAAAVALINTQLKLGSAQAQGAQDVDLLSDSTGVDASIQVVSADAGITTKLGISAGTATTLSGSINYGTGALELSYPDGYVPSTNALAVLEGTQTGPFNMNPADTLVVDTNAGGDETATFDAGPAQADGAAGTFAAMAAETMDVQVDGGDVQTVTFGTEATQALAVQLMNEQLIGCHAVALDASNVRIESDSLGTDAEIILSNTDAGITTKIGLSNGTSSGTGDVANINAVTAAEVKTVVEADTTDLTVTVNADQSVTLSAATSVNVNATSDLETILGLSTTIVSTTQSPDPILASYVSTPLRAAGAATILKVPNLSEIEELVLFAQGVGAAVRLDVNASPLG